MMVKFLVSGFRILVVLVRRRSGASGGPRWRSTTASRLDRGLGRGEFLAREPQVAVLVRRLEPRRGAHRPFFEAQKIVAVGIERAESGGARGEHLVARDD